jgi:Ca2+-transporting ATPase
MNSKVPNGLTQEKAKKLLQKHGPNHIESAPPPTTLELVFNQIKNPLIFILIIAGLVTILLRDYSDSIVIFAAVILNTILGYIQERKAFKTLDSLKKVVTTQAVVIRGGKRQTINTKDLVPGDIVEIYQGDKIPADSIIVQANNLYIDESILTGESVPVEKLTPNEGIEPEFSLESPHHVFMGTSITSGIGIIQITRTGMHTEIGKISSEIKLASKNKTPLEKRLNKLAKFITWGVLLISIGIFTYGMAVGHSLTEMLTISVALAVAAIPEGLVVGLTAILAVGMYRILKRKAVVKKLVAAETLGTVDTICVDKTGTLTMGELQVTETEFTDTKQAFITSIIANDERDPLEFARLKWASTQAKHNKTLPSIKKIRSMYEVTDKLPFSSSTQFLAAQTKDEIHLVGAPEAILKLCDPSKEEKQTYLDHIQINSNRGLRIIGLAHLKCTSQNQAKKLWSQLKDTAKIDKKANWLGIISYTDPIRPSVEQALLKTEKAGINTIVITGDYPGTARTVMNELHIPVAEEEIVTGDILDKMTLSELKKAIKTVKLFARTKPEQKLRIVKALKSQNHVVAMMGDGVNDAPALAAADIGMVVGSASEVAQEAADIVLLDSNFHTIVAAIEEGRGIFQNLRKMVLYLLSDTFSEIIIVLGGLVFGLPIPLTAAQILWVNLVNDSLPSLALTLDPKDKDILKRKPIKPHVPIMNTEMRVIILIISGVTGVSTFLLFKHFHGIIPLDTARSMAYAVLAVGSLFFVFSCQTLEKSIFSQKPWHNPWLLKAVMISLGIAVLPFYVPFLRTLLQLTPLSMQEWGFVLTITFGVITLIETIKFIWRKVFIKSEFIT